MTHKSLYVLENECEFDVLEHRNGRQARLDASMEDRLHIQASCPTPSRSHNQVLGANVGVKTKNFISYSDVEEDFQSRLWM